MQQRSLGTQGLSVPALGLGCMGMSFAYGERDDAESARTIQRALDLGVALIDTADLSTRHDANVGHDSSFSPVALGWGRTAPSEAIAAE